MSASCLMPSGFERYFALRQVYCNLGHEVTTPDDPEERREHSWDLAPWVVPSQ